MIKIFTLGVICISLYVTDLTVRATRINDETTKVQNELTPSEKLKGWKLLFDGKTTTGWRNYRKQTIGKDWIVDAKEGVLMLNAKQLKKGQWKAEGGDLMTNESYENYELRLDWKIDSCGNSGIIYNVIEDSTLNDTYNSGEEMQILDNSCHPDAKIKKHRAGDLYDLISCSVETVKPANQWNKVKIIQKNGNVEQWLNDVKVVSYSRNDANWKKLIAGSKFKDMPNWGLSKNGHIALQDHGNKVYFRNIKIKTL